MIMINLNSYQFSLDHLKELTCSFFRRSLVRNRENR